MSKKKVSSRKRKRINNFKEREFERLNGVCPFCSVAMTLEKDKRNSATFDHIISKKQGGTDGLWNGQIMCAECNSRKGSHSFDFFVKHRLWELPRGPHLTLLMTQRHVSATGDIKAMRAMGKMCLRVV